MKLKVLFMLITMAQSLASDIPTYALDNTHGVGINTNLRAMYYYTRSLWGWEGPLGWDMISINGAFKCCLLKL